MYYILITIEEIYFLFLTYIIFYLPIKYNYSNNYFIKSYITHIL